MQRAPIRDWVTASAFSRYGFNPLTGLKGLLQRASKNIPVIGSDRAKELHQMGVGMSGMVGSALDRAPGELTKMKMGLAENALRRIGYKMGIGSHRAVPVGDSVRASINTAGRAINPLRQMENASVTFEEGTRIGAASRALSRIRRGEGYTPLTSLDMAIRNSRGTRNRSKAFRRMYGYYRRPERNRRVAEAYPHIDPVNEMDALFEGRDVTIDFGKGGAGIKKLNYFAPFTNSQGAGHGEAASSADREAAQFHDQGFQLSDTASDV